MGQIFSPTRDRNEPDIIKALVSVGCVVQKLHEGGVPDLLVGFRGRTFLLEVKGLPGKKGGSSSVSLTPTQEKWWSAWNGERPIIVRTVEESLRVIGLHVVTPGLYSHCREHPECDGRDIRCCCVDRHILATYPRAKPIKKKP